MCAAAAAWLLTGPHTLATINWDQAVYVVHSLRGPAPLRSPWNAHAAIGHIYYPAAWLAMQLGATAIDGFRAANALFFGLGAAVLAAGLAALGAGPALAGSLTIWWATAFPTLFLVMTLEDNVLYMAPATALLLLLVRRASAWRRRDSVVGGALLAAAALCSWQALLYLGPLLYAAATADALGPPAAQRSLRERVVAVVLCPLTCVGVLLGWCVFASLTGGPSLVQMVRTLFSRPSGNFAFRRVTELGGAAAALGDVASRLIEHRNLVPVTPVAPRWLLGVGLYLVSLAAVAACSWLAWRRRHLGPHYLAVTLGGFLSIIPFYVEPDYRYLVRVDFLPGLLAILACLLVREHRRASAVVSVVALLAAGLQLRAALRWTSDVHQLGGSLPSYIGQTNNPATWYGRDGKSWFRYFRDLRLEHPGRCRFLLHTEEVRHARWWPEVEATLYSELPRYELVGSPDDVATWKIGKPHAVTPDAAREQHLDEACAWVSADAARALAEARRRATPPAPPPPPAPLVAPAPRR